MTELRCPECGGTGGVSTEHGNDCCGSCAGSGRSEAVMRLADALPAILNFEFFVYPVGHEKWIEVAERILSSEHGSAA